MVEGGSENREEQKGITRRRVTLGILLAAVAGAFGSLLSLVKVLSPSKKGGGYVATVSSGDKLVYAQGSQEGDLLQASSFQVGDAVLAYPQGKSKNQANLVQLIRLKEAEYKAPTRIGPDRSGVCGLQRHLHPSRLHRFLGREQKIARHLLYRVLLPQQYLQSGPGSQGHRWARTGSSGPDRRQGVQGRNTCLHQRIFRSHRAAGMNVGR